MINSRAIGKEEYDQIMGAREKSKASVLAMEAARDRARVNLGYTTVKSPLTGRISRRMVDPGNLVRADETLLTTIVADDSVWAYFDVDERTYLDLVGEKPSTSPSPSACRDETPRADAPGQRGGIHACRQRGLRRQPAQRQHRHDPHARRVPEPEGHPQGGAVRRASACRSADRTRRCSSPTRHCRATRDGSSSTSSTATAGWNIARSRSARRSTNSASIKEGLKPGERVIVNGMQRVRPKVRWKSRCKTHRRSPDFPLGKLLRLSQAKPADVRRR